MSARQLIVLVVAAIAAIGALVLIRTMGNRNSAPHETAEAVAGEQVLVAAKDIPQGAALTPSDLAVRVFPQGSVTEAFVRLSSQPSAQADFVGAVTRRGFAAGEPIMQGSVIQPEGHGFMAAQLRPGYRAVAVEITAATGAGGFIGANDHVDVILTRTIEGHDGGNANQTVRSETIIEDVRVLAVDDVVQPQTAGEAPERHVAEVAVLELSPQDAHTLAQGDEMGDISLALRGVQADVVGMSTQRGRSLEQESGSVRVHAFGTVTGGR